MREREIRVLFKRKDKGGFIKIILFSKYMDDMMHDVMMMHKKKRTDKI
jgi:hypothetical protein